MEPEALQPIGFRYRSKGKGGRRGLLCEDRLVLDGEDVPLERLLKGVRSPGCLLLVFEEPREGSHTLLLWISGTNGPYLLAEMNRRISRRRAELHRRQLQQEGNGHGFRSLPCPNCRSTVDLSELPATPEFHCAFCGTIHLQDGRTIPRSADYRVCESCGRFGRLKRYSAIYFLWVHLHWEIKCQCAVCMWSNVLPMLVVNLLTVLAFPVSVYQAVRAFAGDSQHYAGLTRANAAARRQAERACRLYEGIEQRLVHCAGVRYNHGLVLLKAGRADEAVEQFSQAVSDCANFDPAWAVLDRLEAAGVPAAQA